MGICFLSVKLSGMYKELFPVIKAGDKTIRIRNKNLVMNMGP